MQSAQHKKLYENALSTSQSTQTLEKALSSVLRLAIGDHSHFNFLLYNIHWFSEPYLYHFSILQKALRFYRGRGKESEKVAYNILADGMWSSVASEKVCNCLINLIKNGFDQRLLKQSLKENYPHKITELEVQQTYLKSLLYLYEKVEKLRFDILQMILLELATLDTELSNFNQISDSYFPPDSQTKATQLKVQNSSQHNKLDTLLTILLQELFKYKNDETIYKKLLLIFKNDLVLIDQSNYVQFIIYCFAQNGKQYAKEFVAFLLGEIMEKMESKSNRKVLISLANYLASYVSRSVTLTPTFISKTVSGLLKLTNSLIDKKAKERRKSSDTLQQFLGDGSQKINLSEVLEQNFDILLLLQTILWIWITRSECRDHNYEEVKKLLKKCQQVAYYKYFIPAEIIDLSQLTILADKIEFERKIEVVHKFKPNNLKKLSMYVDPLLKPYAGKIEKVDSSLKIEQIKSESMPSKRVKSEKRESGQTLTTFV